MDDSDLQKAASIIAGKLNKGHTEEEARQVLKSTGYSDADLEEIIGAARVLRKQQPANLEAAFGPEPAQPQPMPVSQNVYVQQSAYAQKKGHKGLIIGVITAIILVILLLILFLFMQKPGNGGISLNAGNGTQQGGGSSGILATVQDTNSLLSEGFKTEISRVRLNDNRNSIKEIELKYAPNSGSLSYNRYRVKFDLFKGTSRASGFVGVFPGRTNAEFELFGKGAITETYRMYTLIDAVAGNESNCPYSNLLVANMEGIVASSSYSGAWYLGLGDGYCHMFSNKCSCYWYPCDIEPGEYELRVTVIGQASSEPKNIGYVAKTVKFGPDAPLNQ